MSFFSKIENWFKKVFGSTNWEKTASAVITVIAPMTETVITLTAGDVAAAAVQVVINQVQSDLAAVAALVSSAGSKVTITSVLNAVTTNLKSLLTAGDIKDAKTLTSVTSIVDTVVGEVEAILKVVA